MIDEEVAKLAAQNRQSAQALPAFFARNGVPISALREQLRAGIAWAMVVQRKLRPQVNVTDTEVEAEASRLSAAAGQPEYLAAEIFLPVEGPAQDAKVRQTALKLIEQMARGVRFSSVARQFSQAPSAARGGDLGWLRSGQLEPELDSALRALSPGTLTQPVKTSSGYHILMLREQRMIKAPSSGSATQVTFNLRQVLIPVDKKATQSAIDASTRKLEELRATAKSCADMERIAGELGDSNRGNLGKVRYTELPAALQPVIAALPDATTSTPLRNDRGVLFLMVCDRASDGAISEADRDAITQRLGAQRLELLARRYLRDLRQDAFVDIRS
jgi:peptidyl-prolyl cis-trans isomerase SurA